MTDSTTVCPIVKLGSVAETQLGKMLSQKAHDGAPLRPYLRNRDVRWGGFNLTDLPTMAFNEAESKKFALQYGDLLVCEGGEVGRAAIWRNQLPEVHFQKAIHRVRCSAQILPEYLLYLFLHYSQERRFEEHVTGTTIAHLPQEDLRNLEIPLPRIEEQLRLVATIERLFSRFDSAERTFETVLRKIAISRRTILARAFSGLLAVVETA